MNSIEELRAQQTRIAEQIQAAEQVQREERQRQEEVARQAKVLEKQRLELHSKTGISKGIADALKEMRPGIEVTFNEGHYPSLKINGTNEGYHMSYNEKYESTSYSHTKKATGMFYIVVETGLFNTYDAHARHGRMRRAREATKRFPPRKDGTHAYTSIAEWLLQLHDLVINRASKAHVAKVNQSKSQPILAQLADKYGRKKGVVMDTCTLDGSKVTFQFTSTLSFEQADKLIQTLEELGLTS